MKKIKAQAWGIDLVIAVSIFLVGIAIFFLYSMNIKSSESDFESLKYDGEMIANALMSEGSPSSWTLADVVKPGILENNQISDRKLELFYNLSSQQYSKSKIVLGTKYDYYFFLSENITLPSGDIEGLGRPGFDPDNINADSLVKITRFTIYKNKPVTAVVYIWK